MTRSLKERFGGFSVLWSSRWVQRLFWYHGCTPWSCLHLRWDPGFTSGSHDGGDNKNCRVVYWSGAVGGLCKAASKKLRVAWVCFFMPLNDLVRHERRIRVYPIDVSLVQQRYERLLGWCRTRMINHRVILSPWSGREAQWWRRHPFQALPSGDSDQQWYLGLTGSPSTSKRCV